MLRRLVQTAAAEARATGQMERGDCLGEGDGIAAGERGLPMPLAGPSNRPVRERSWRKLNFPTEDFVRHGALARAADPPEAGQVGLEGFGFPIGGAEGTHVGDMSLRASSAEGAHEAPMRPKPGPPGILECDIDPEAAA